MVQNDNVSVTAACVLQEHSRSSDHHSIHAQARCRPYSRLSDLLSFHVTGYAFILHCRSEGHGAAPKGNDKQAYLFLCLTNSCLDLPQIFSDKEGLQFCTCMSGKHLGTQAPGEGVCFQENTVLAAASMHAASSGAGRTRAVTCSKKQAVT